MGFVSSYRAIRVAFNIEDLFTANYVLGGMMWYQSSGGVFDQSIIFSTHGLTPLLVLSGLSDSGWFSLRRRVGSYVKVKNGFWLKDVVFGSCLNGARRDRI